ncbi:hypothetical protein [Amycolatopsis sp. NPDC051071]|uniref:hypothetical protein n=1 Tax=Amycolatopsis sp. NPDC051071 TaxID=3154637 RepID=UPI003447B0CA
MSLRADSFVSIARRLRTAADAFESVAGAADSASGMAPQGAPARPVDGVSRPVEDVILAREDAGLYWALDATRRHAVQAVLHTEAATQRARQAGRSLKSDRAAS